MSHKLAANDRLSFFEWANPINAYKDPSWNKTAV